MSFWIKLLKQHSSIRETVEQMLYNSIYEQVLSFGNKLDMRPASLHSKKEKYFSTLDWTQDFLQEDRTQKMYQELYSILSADIKLNVLDIGSGDGVFVDFLQSKFPQHIYYGCDVSKEAIKNNKEKKTIYLLEKGRF